MNEPLNEALDEFQGAGTMEPPRRSFMYKLGTVAVGAVLPLPAIAAAVASLIDPAFLSRRKKLAPSGSVSVGSATGFYAAAPAAALSAAPQLVQIIADRKDAWNTFPKQAIGAIYLQKISDARVAFENTWKEEASLKAAVDAAPADKKDAVFAELLEAEFAIQRRLTERGEKKWKEEDTDNLVDKYKKAFPDRTAAIDKVARMSKWEAGVRVFNNICPHAGCAVDFRSEANGQGKYFCPCHNSKFATDGTRDVASPSARDLDNLDYVLQNGTVFVRFLNFKPGEAERHAQ